ncbi:FGGY-family carbohydrate kinase [Limnofasciculus baicalensis]|uniref:D-ribulose kinase n=1 Tax=Limnofasciculus baicalensis BBK-W-15 TaxID=2699891 RepID=A0AAE3GPM7_9CYAN|nr:FGGY-family carbohydrate kinase [Limnofasciculus baicalensis]MCP2728425.1 FGGY-family carbohydrate kinase [Limnofasciculus baicalensis BBK-W-15]
MNFYLGIDFGTSGARAIVIDSDNIIQAEAQYSFASISGTDLAGSWRNALFSLIGQIPQEIIKEINAIAINGTSSTVLLCDADGNPLAEPILYNDGRGLAVMAQLKAIAPPNHVVLSATSSLAKLLWLSQNSQVKSKNYYFLHQADWLAFLLHGKPGISDYHNALKLGYNPETLSYPDWLQNLPEISILPQVLAPGTPIAEITVEIANKLGLTRNCLVCAGTTDSIAAFLASGANSPGEAVTSLGSTLVLKLLSYTRVEDIRYGIYSHRLGDLWLTGGASNTGGAVLREFFSDNELECLSRELNPKKESLLDYYPLLKPGERFPINDPNLTPRLEPKPARSVEFLHGLLESIARIEGRGYQLLQELGATRLTHIYTAGGGAKNMTWTAIRARQLQVPILPSAHTAAAYGTALLSKSQLDGLS